MENNNQPQNNTSPTPGTEGTPYAPPVTVNGSPMQPEGSNGLAVGALVAGILAFLSGWILFAGIVLGITAVVLGIIALKKPAGKGMSITGIVLGAIGGLTSLLLTVLFFVGVSLFGGAINEIGKQVEQTNQQAQQRADAKKDFAKGDTAVFGDYEVKVNSVTRDFVTGNEFIKPAEGKEYIVLNYTVKNITDETKSFSPMDFKVDEKGVSGYYDFSVTPPAPAIDTKDIAAGAEMTGNKVYEVTKGATDLKIVYEAYNFNFTGDSSKDKINYSLAF